MCVCVCEGEVACVIDLPYNIRESVVFSRVRSSPSAPYIAGVWKGALFFWTIFVGLIFGAVLS